MLICFRNQVVASAAKSKRDMDVIVCCPYVFLAPVAEVCKGSKVKVGAEDVFIEDKGAFTGGVAISQVLVFLPSLFLRGKCAHVIPNVLRFILQTNLSSYAWPYLQIKSVGCDYVVIGHSERRHGNIASETDAMFNKKVCVCVCV